MALTSRQIVRTGVAEFFGGTTYDREARAYRGASAPLLPAGISTVRAYQPKRMSDIDYVMTQAAGRGMGAAMVVEVPLDVERRDAKPAITGRKRITYQVILHLFHLAYLHHAEDAEADVDAMIEAVKDLIHTDPSLGGICFQAGESRMGIRSRVYPSAALKEKLGTAFDITFEAEVEIVA